MKREKEPLYRKVNTKARGCFHHSGSDARHDRNTKKGLSKSMKKDVRRGLDYTPLFKFLLSKVGQKWEDVYSEAKSRLDQEDPIFWMIETDSNPESASIIHSVMTDVHKKLHYGAFRVENSNYSKLIIDENGLIQIKDPSLANEDFTPSCPCCTHTFNGKPLNKKWK